MDWDKSQLHIVVLDDGYYNKADKRLYNEQLMRELMPTLKHNKDSKVKVLPYAKDTVKHNPDMLYMLVSVRDDMTFACPLLLHVSLVLERLGSASGSSRCSCLPLIAAVSIGCGGW